MLTKKSSAALAVITTIWLPLSLFLNPGWGTFLLFTPYALIALVPLVAYLVLFGRYSADTFPKLDGALQLIFYVSWIVIGLTLINGGDTQESVHSILTAFIPFEHREPWNSVSYVATQGAFWLSIVVFAAVLYLRWFYPAQKRRGE